MQHLRNRSAQKASGLRSSGLDSDRQLSGQIEHELGGLVGGRGLEPLASCMSSKCSNQLS
jgi:hypothetical protein